MHGAGAALHVFLYILIAIIVLRTIYKMHAAWSDEDFNVDQNGDSRWTTIEELKEQFLAIDELETPYEGRPGTLISSL